MSNPRELRERFQPRSTQEKNTSSEVGTQISDILGVAANDMHEIIVGDITGMIDKGYRSALEGYVLCLSRIIDHKKVWKSIVEAFHQKNEKVPSKYYSQFGQTEEKPASKGMVVK